MALKLLIVDNDKFYREMLSGFLREEGYDVAVASDGIEVLEKISEIKPDGVVLDLVMENLDGDQVVKFLRRNEEFKNIPIVVLSGLVSEKIPEVKELDADIFIPKSDAATMKIALAKNLRGLFKSSTEEEYGSRKSKTAAKDAQEIVIFELLNKSKNLQMILDNLSEGILVTDNKFKITYVNQSCLKIVDASAENILGKNLNEYLASINTRPKTIEEITNYKFSLGKTKASEVFYNDKILVLKTSYFKKGKGFSGTLIAIADMTEQRTFEKKMEDEYKKRTEELERTYRELHKTNLELIKASEIKSQFVANVSHELRSPMNDIMGFVQLLQAKIYGPTTEKQDEALRNIMINSNSLLKMINEILDVTKLDKGQMPLATSRFHPREIIEQVIGGYSWIGETKQIDIQVIYSDNLPTIETDDTKLKRILLNLLDNAVKFTEKGHIHLKVENIPEDKAILFGIEDTGIGISEQDQEIIFLPFRQIDGSTTRKFGGVGLGLYIVKKLVEMINGTITLKSKIGEGTTFYVKIPYSIKEET